MARARTKTKGKPAYQFDSAWSDAQVEANAEDTQTLRWIAIRDKGTCQGAFANACFPRHGVTRTYAEWKKAGLPGSRVLNCSHTASRCRCTLANPRATGEIAGPINASEAVERGRKRATEAAKKAYSGRRKKS